VSAVADWKPGDRVHLRSGWRHDDALVEQNGDVCVFEVESVKVSATAKSNGQKIPVGPKAVIRDLSTSASETVPLSRLVPTSQ
jgi:hypothetical protein